MQSYSKIRYRKGIRANFPRHGLVIAVRPRPDHRSQGLLTVGARTMRCALGRSGIAALKREGDGATPLASMRVVAGYYRPGRTHLKTLLPMKPIRRDLGWCDLPSDRNYNRPVRLPYGGSHEGMYRKDHLYDVVLVLDWNLRPRTRGKGSAIFLHLARPGYTPTEGCVAVSARDMAWLLGRVKRGMKVRVLR
ncbi:MAG: L,D-transpeptidase family protein [Rhizobiaceae bacterium]|nr:L,D-transpeptidase family protein [Rhizobiaceae bacterium]